MEFQNPIIPGFAPDPSVIFVESEDTYFLVNSSFHVFPGLPIYASKNLNEWTHIGNAINRHSQLSLHGSAATVVPLGENDTLVAAGGLFAPTLRWHKGTFYVICTNFAQDRPDTPQCQNFYVAASDIWSGQWSNPVFFDFQGIDPSLFFDDDDRAYIQGSYRDGPLHELNCTIRQFEIDIATGRPLSEIKYIWGGYAGRNDAEGPHIYKKDGCYYLVTAEGGTFEGHLISIAKSTNIWGPYETYSINPLLTAEGKNEEIRHTGHGDLFQGRDGSWWCACLGIRYNNGSYPMGRETFLTPVNWPTGEWPQISHPQINFTRKVKACDNSPQESWKTTNENSFVYLRDAKLADYDIDGDIITLKPSQVGLSSIAASPSFIGQRQRHLNDSATVALRLSSAGKDMEAGLSILKDEYRHLDIYYESASAEIILRSVHLKEAEPDTEIIAQKPIAQSSDGKLWVRIQGDSEKYTFSYATKQNEWCNLGSISSKVLVTKDFTGTIFGIFATKKTSDGGLSKVIFEEFNVQPEESLGERFSGC